MPVSQLGDMTWEEVRSLASNTVGILPTGAVEAHGPHLPLNTDVVIAEAMARAGAEKLAARGVTVVILPPLVYTAARFGAGFAGTVSVDREVVTNVVCDIVRSLAEGEGKGGIRLVAAANAHLDPAHLASLHEAVARCREGDEHRFIFPDITRKPWGSRLTDEFRSGACHAGRFETSIVMAARPDLVKEALRRELEPNPASLSAAILNGLVTFEEAGGQRAYFGFPAEASKEEGQKTIDVLGSILAESVLDGLEANGGMGGEA